MYVRRPSFRNSDTFARSLILTANVGGARPPIFATLTLWMTNKGRQTPSPVPSYRVELRLSISGDILPGIPARLYAEREPTDGLEYAVAVSFTPFSREDFLSKPMDPIGKRSSRLSPRRLNGNHNRRVFQFVVRIRPNQAMHSKLGCSPPDSRQTWERGL